jgi:exodeoxyribonuclease V alpha subunit
MNLGKDQEKALEVLKDTGVKIITGGPGVGKTTTLKEIIRIYEAMYPDRKIRLAAPTGRAAQRMTESTEKEASTIHRLIEYKPFEDYETFAEEVEGDVFIIDEMSMTDVLLFSMLLQAIPSGALVLLVGDEDQLAAVGAGDVLHDLIRAGLPTYRLREIFRQAGDNSIVVNYKKIHSGDWNLILDDRFRLLTFDTAEQMQEKTMEIVKEYQRNGTFGELQILSTVKKKYDCGTITMNNMIQSVVNGNEKGLIFGSYHYRVHDKVILMRNNYEKNYFNGDIGEIIEIHGDSVTVQIGEEEVTLEEEELEDLSLAYALTTHKAQGSEFPDVIVLLPTEPANMLQLRLFGTAISRAKRKVYVIAQTGAIEIIKEGRNDRKRNTGLTEKVRDVL